MGQIKPRLYADCPRRKNDVYQCIQYKRSSPFTRELREHVLSICCSDPQQTFGVQVEDLFLVLILDARRSD